VRLACDDSLISSATAARIAELAVSETNIEVRCQMACSAKRLPVDQALPIVASLLQHDDDLDDPRQPLLIWWVLESKCEQQAEAVLAFWKRLGPLQRQPLVASFVGEKLMRRFAAAGSRSDMLHCATLFTYAVDQATARRLLTGFQAGVEGRAIVDLPSETMEALRATGIRSRALELRRGEPSAIAESCEVIVDQDAQQSERLELIQILGQIQAGDSVKPLLQVIQESDDSVVRAAAISALQVFPLDEVGSQVIALLSTLDASAQHVATTMLTSRETWTLQTLRAIAGNQLDKELLDRNALQRAVTHPLPEIHRLVTDLYGSIEGGTNAQMNADINQFLAEWQAGEADRYAGKELFNEQCAKCHRLFESAIDQGQFGDLGPDLTAYQRSDVRNMLIHIVNPNAEIREGFEQLLVMTDDGRIVTGCKQDEDNQVVVLRGTDGKSLVVSKDDIELMEVQKTSIMPEGILQKLTAQQRCDLLAYLQSTQPLND
jgi:putative heme-binding domain-containing protein